MGELFNIINEYLPVILAVMIFIIALQFIFVIVLFKSLGKLENRYRKLMRGTSGKNIEEIMMTEIATIESANLNSEKALKKCEEISKRMKDCIQKVAIMRYKAFEDVGSDLSFSVAILDDNNDGVIITGIYGRSESTTYAKPVDKGISRYDLSEEEICVLNEAVNKYIEKRK